MDRNRAALAVGACLATLLLAGSARAAVHHLDYLTIDANEGGSAGGHAAIRLGDRTYHFQHARGGLLVLERDASERFEYLYTKLGNRSLRVSRVPVDADTYGLLREAFDRYHLVQREQLAALDAARGDREFYGALLAASRGEPAQGMPLRGAGLFDVRAAPGRSPALVALAAGIAEAHGDDFVSRRRAALRGAPRLDPPVDAADFRRAAAPAFHYAASQRAADRMEGWVALDVLEAAPALRPGVVRRPAGDAFALDASERRALRRFAAKLHSDLVALAASARPDWGAALLAGMARLAAVEASVASGRLVFLDGFADDVAAVPLARLGDDAARATLLAEAGAELEAARAPLRARALDEAGYARLEWAANHYREACDALRDGRPVRLQRAAPVPWHRAPRPDLLATVLLADQLDASRLSEARDAAAAREHAMRTSLEELYRYHLLRHNCVSEIFDTIDAAFGGAARAREESRRRLGGHVATSGNLNFVPFVSERAVRSRYDVAERFEIPSHRRARLAAMREQEPGLAVALRESNTLTSTVYRRNAGDSLFLFFTDANAATRPLAGAFNLAAAVGESAVGVLLLPFDGGHTLWLGAKGVAMSLPELFFVNIRKGTHAWVPADEAADS